MINDPIGAAELAAIIAAAAEPPPSMPAVRYVQKGMDLVCTQCGYAVPYCKGHSMVDVMRDAAEQIAEASMAARIAEARARHGGR